ncbi:hypothetical protein CHS0354_015949 [Potamilus streckersoni]|uniref:Phospholipase A2 n=1 Tax=Potamilus streckersoni TaxID=2493646 RepID=A0AAE0SY76_9BIVA|nr:hypothetical protein CHS0354_015949 [Potamilus streckersoni]
MEYDGDITILPQNDVTILPQNDDTILPQNDDTILPLNDVTISPQNDITISPQNDGTISPHYDVTISPQNDVTISPHNDVTISPQNDVTILPQNDDTILPLNDVTISPQNDITISPQNDGTISPHYDVTISPQNDVTISPHNDVTISPQNDVTILPQNDDTILPLNDVTISPQNDITISPQNDGTVSPHYDVTISPQNDVTISPHNDVTISPQNDVTISPLSDVTISPQNDVTISPQNYKEQDNQSRKDMSLNRFDPFQVFEVDHLPCLILYVKVVKGRNITKGWARDLLDVPDPYLKLQIRTSPNGIQRTTTKDNDVNPIWNETFKFYINLCAKNQLELVLMDANYFIDEHLSTKTILLTEFDLQHQKYEQTVKFNDTSEVDIEIWADKDNDPMLRYSLTLCDMEKEFLEKRRKRVFEAMKRILGNCAPESLKEVPTIAVIGSGGGFRAMTALCGVFSALVDSEILDMVTYAAGLSGSAWYLSTLYSHPDWPEKTPNDLKGEIRNSISSSLFWLLNPQSMYRYMSRIMEKRRHGQPVSFTDFFGHLVGETLLKGRLDTKLTDQREKLKDGSVPLPMYTCLHVKKHVSAMVFHG